MLDRRALAFVCPSFDLSGSSIVMFAPLFFLFIVLISPVVLSFLPPAVVTVYAFSFASARDLTKSKSVQVHVSLAIRIACTSLAHLEDQFILCSVNIDNHILVFAQLACQK